MSPLQLKASGHLVASPARVWARLVDQGAISDWFEPVRAVASDGDQLLVHLAGRSGQDWVPGEVLSVEPRRRLDLSLRGPTPQLREVRIEVDLVATERGTDFVVQVTAVPSLLGNLAVPLLRLGWEVTMARAVRGFRAALEARGAAKEPGYDELCREHRVSPSEAARLEATAAL